ncbi:hypothetical protein AVEN_42141-1 [Araneus ventricosus]|uniref:Uncharacterized protein n=1 Tax=Araneus ventricosus TaxID=182803 RepID=A0A4Y2D4L8_ARAVE|nr:hypothetical protein AVEN_42141-1 [Araneus ventricosus]
MTRAPLSLGTPMLVCKVIVNRVSFLQKGEGLGRKRRNGASGQGHKIKKKKRGSHKCIISSISVVSVAMMGRWNSKGCQTRVKWFKVHRQKEDVSLAAGRGVRDTERAKENQLKTLK